MSDIQDEAYSEAMDEIARLKQRLKDFSQKETYKEWQRNQAELAKLQQRVAFMASNDYVHSLTSEIERLAKLYRASLEALAEQGALLTRAAEALEFWMKDLASTEQQYVDAAMRDERLLAELRKAAQ